MTDQDKFLQRKFIYDVQWFVGFLTGLFIAILWALFSIYVLKINDDQGFSIPWIGVGFYNLFTYIWSKKMAEKYGIELFGDLDQEWLRKEQGYDAKIFGEIYSKNLHFRKLGAKSLFITVPLSFLPWPAIPFIVGIIMIVVYIVYRKVYFNDAMADRWPRVYGSGIVISRILDQDSDFGKKDNKEEKN